MNQYIAHWYYYNVIALARIYVNISYDEEFYSWILINSFPLPSNFKQSDTALLIRTPGYNIENYFDYHFYMDLELERYDGRHVNHLFENSSYNDFYNLKYSKLSFHLFSFKPAIPISKGDTLIDVCRALYNFLGTGW